MLQAEALTMKEILTQKIQPKLQSFFRKEGRPFRLMVLFVYIPTILLGLYFSLLASNMYISESMFALRTGELSDLAPVANPLMRAASPAISDAYIVQASIASTDMLEKVEKKINLYQHFAASSRDIFSRLNSNPTREEMLKYWQWLTSASYDPDKGIISLQVKAYTPAMAQAISQAILEGSEELVNQMNARSHQDSLRLTKAEVTMAEERLMQARIAMQRFRDEKSMLDPQIMAQSLETVIANLEAEAASAQAELNAELQVMHKNSPRIITIKTKLQALQGQIAKEKSRLAGLNGPDSTLSALVGDYARLLTEEEFAQQQLLTAMAAFEGARMRAIAQTRYLIPFQPPTLPQESLYPRPLLFTLFGFVALLVGLGICSLVIASIKDHMGV